MIKIYNIRFQALIFLIILDQTCKIKKYLKIIRLEFFVFVVLQTNKQYMHAIAQSGKLIINHIYKRHEKVFHDIGFKERKAIILL